MTASRPSVLVAALVLVTAAIAAYHNSLDGPFVFDDRASILDNASIRQSWPEAFSPPAGGLAVSGRPLVNVSLAVNHRLGGTNPWGYHVFNLLVHVAAGLTVFGLVRRAWPQVNQSARDGALPVAWGVALLWMLHPLNTAAVTYVVQRAESLMGLFYLLTFYGFIRGVTASAHSRWWLTGSVVACALGMATKETMVTAPLMVLLYDRIFVAGKFVDVLRQRRGYYLALAATWLVLLLLLLESRGRGGTVGFNSGTSGWHYLLTQSEAITLYLKLSLWPHPLVFDHGERVVIQFTEVLPQILVVVGLLSATVIALKRWPAAGFLGTWFFVILAPTSSVVPIASHTIAEHRMYLPLIAVMVGVIVGIRALAGRKAWMAVVFLAVAAGGLTWGRNRIYRSEIALWTDTVGRVPQNVRAQVNLGGALLDVARVEEAVTAYETAAQLQPNSAEVRINLCHAYAKLGRLGEAIEQGEAALRLEPGNADAHVNLASALVQRGRLDDAIAHYRAALRLRPAATDVARALADGLVKHAQTALRQSRRVDATQNVEEALRLAPDHVEAHFLQGNLAAAAEDYPAAIQSYERVLELDAGHAAAQGNLANCQLVMGRFAQAVENYEALLRAKPNDAAVRRNLEIAREMARSGGRDAR